jgi:hypothetical protein
VPSQPGERQLHLGLDPGDLRDPEAGRLAGAVAQQRRLADAGLAPDDQCRARTAAYLVQQPVQHLALAGSAPERRRALSGHLSTGGY